MDKVSVLMPTYNVERYIEKAVKCILNQTYKNIELIIVDDCSSDKTYEILRQLSEIDERIKLFRNVENKKICYTLNEALRNSTGKYILRMDGDDLCELDRIEVQLKFLIDNPNIDLVGTSTISIDENDNKISTMKMIGSYKNLKKILLIATPVLHIWMARREVYESLNGYREIPYVEDYDFLLRMNAKGYKFCNISEYYGYSVRKRQGNTVSSVGLKQRKAFNYVRKLYKERLRKGYDSFDENSYTKAIMVKKRELIKYNKSLEFLEKAIIYKSDKNLIWVLYILKSILTSKYQSVYILRSFILRFYSRIINLIELERG